MKKRIWYLIIITVILGGLVMKNLFATIEASSRKQEQDRIGGKLRALGYQPNEIGFSKDINSNNQNVNDIEVIYMKEE